MYVNLVILRISIPLSRENELYKILFRFKLSSLKVSLAPFDAPLFIASLTNCVSHSFHFPNRRDDVSRDIRSIGWLSITYQLITINLQVCGVPARARRRFWDICGPAADRDRYLSAPLSRNQSFQSRRAIRIPLSRSAICPVRFVVKSRHAPPPRRNNRFVPPY